VQARAHLQTGDIHSIIDPTLHPLEYDINAMWKVAEVGVVCVEPISQNRPGIRDVLKELAEAIEMEVVAGHGLPGHYRLAAEGVPPLLEGDPGGAAKEVGPIGSGAVSGRPGEGSAGLWGEG